MIAQAMTTMLYFMDFASQNLIAWFDLDQSRLRPQHVDHEERDKAFFESIPDSA